MIESCSNVLNNIPKLLSKKRQLNLDNKNNSREEASFHSDNEKKVKENQGEEKDENDKEEEKDENDKENAKDKNYKDKEEKVDLWSIIFPFFFYIIYLYYNFSLISSYIKIRRLFKKLNNILLLFWFQYHLIF